MERRILKLDNLFALFLFKVLKVHDKNQPPDITKYVINILVLLEQNQMIIQIKNDKSGEHEVIRKTLNQDDKDFRLVSKWNEEGDDVNLIAKSLYNHPNGIH